MRKRKTPDLETCKRHVLRLFPTAKCAKVKTVSGDKPYEIEARIREVTPRASGLSVFLGCGRTQTDAWLDAHNLILTPVRRIKNKELRAAVRQAYRKLEKENRAGAVPDLRAIKNEEALAHVEAMIEARRKDLARHCFHLSNRCKQLMLAIDSFGTINADGKFSGDAAKVERFAGEYMTLLELKNELTRKRPILEGAS
jgi:hypothetical protein